VILLLSGGVLSGGGSLVNGLLHMTNYLGNLVLPVISALCVILALKAYMDHHNGGRYLIGALAALLASSFVRLAEEFASRSTGPDEYYTALLTMVNWLGNDIMPIVAVFEVCRGILAFSGFAEGAIRSHRGTAWKRHILIALGCMSVSGTVRLLEFFVLHPAN
jgi:hypothetical protein